MTAATTVTTAPAGSRLPTPAETLELMVNTTLENAVRYAMAHPTLFVDRPYYGAAPATDREHQVLAVVHVIKHRARALADTALTS